MSGQSTDGVVTARGSGTMMQCSALSLAAFVGWPGLTFGSRIYQNAKSMMSGKSLPAALGLFRQRAHALVALLHARRGPATGCT